MTGKAAADADLERLQRSTLGYFLEETNPRNGLVPDNTRDGAPSSITAVGLGLAAYAVAVERNVVTRIEARKRVLTTLRFLRDSPQGEAPDATGYRGFFYTFLHLRAGRRA